jgi:hypothetical protein
VAKKDPKTNRIQVAGGFYSRGQYEIGRPAAALPGTG